VSFHVPMITYVWKVCSCTLMRRVLQFQGLRVCPSAFPATGSSGVAHGQIYTTSFLVLLNNANASASSHYLS
jgi:hypothetical protein